MAIKAILLTTDTTHHKYFAWKCAEYFQWQAIVMETSHRPPPFDTSHPFEARRDEYERDVVLADCKQTYSDWARVLEYDSVNNPACVAAIAKLQPDVLIDVGTGILRSPIIATPRLACLNLHGGNPEKYRGLDSQLWAIYHGELANVMMTLHHVDQSLDTGDIIMQTSLKFARTAELHQLRAINTKAAIDLFIMAIRSLEADGYLPSRRQLEKGRYYSFMPRELKGICVEKFCKLVAEDAQ